MAVFVFAVVPFVTVAVADEGGDREPREPRFQQPVEAEPVEQDAVGVKEAGGDLGQPAGELDLVDQVLVDQRIPDRGREVHRPAPGFGEFQHRLFEHLPRHHLLGPLHVAVTAERAVGVADVRRLDAEVDELVLHHRAEQPRGETRGNDSGDPGTQPPLPIGDDVGNLAHAYTSLPRAGTR